MARENEEAYAEAVRRIEAVKAANADELSLSIGRLQTIPPQIAEIPQLKTLYLDTSDIHDLSPIEGLTSLVHLSASDLPVADIGPIAKLTNLTTLDIHLTKVTDLTPLADLTKLEIVDLAYLGVTDVSPLEKLTNIRTINMKSTGVFDLRPFRNIVIPDSAPEHPEDYRGFVQFETSDIEGFDPRLAEIVGPGYDNFQRVISYLKEIDDADYDRRIAEWRIKQAKEIAPEQDKLLKVSLIKGHIDVSPALPDSAELNDPVKQKSLERLKQAVEVLRRAGNRHNDIEIVSRNLSEEFAKPLAEIDPLRIHFELPLCKSIFDRRNERENDETLSPETISALEVLALVGPGLTLGNDEVDKLEERRYRHDRNHADQIPLELQNDLSRAIADTDTLFGPKIIFYQDALLRSPPDPTNIARQSQGILNKNTVLFMGVSVIFEMASGPLGEIGLESIRWLGAHRELILALAKGWGHGFSHWMAMVMTILPEINHTAQILRDTRRH